MSKMRALATLKRFAINTASEKDMKYIDDAIKYLASYEPECEHCTQLQSQLAECKEGLSMFSEELDSVSMDNVRLQDALAQSQASYRKIADALNREGFNNIETMIARYKTVILAANELSIETDDEIEDLRGQLAESQAREKAAVEEICKVCEALTHATGHGWEDGCVNCEWWRGVQGDE